MVVLIVTGLGLCAGCFGVGFHLLANQFKDEAPDYWNWFKEGKNKIWRKL